MDEKSAVERVDAAYEKLTAANARIKSLEKKLADGTLTMKEGAELTDLRAQAFGTAFSGKVLDIAQDERESACTELLRKRCDVPFQRIRRITGYLVGDLGRFNNAKRHEVDDRVKHMGV